MKTDPAIRRTRDARRAVSARLDEDPAKVVEYDIEMQKRFAERLCVGPGAPRQGRGWAGPAAGAGGGRALVG